jgi:hypothetical protein
VKGIQVCSNDDSWSFSRGDNNEKCRNTLKIFFKIFFSRTTGPISFNLGTNHPWVKGIQVCSNEGSDPLQRGDNLKNAKIGCGNSKIFFSRTT